jgi:hypothetical protein
MLAGPNLLHRRSREPALLPSDQRHHTWDFGIYLINLDVL